MMAGRACVRAGVRAGGVSAFMAVALIVMRELMTSWGEGEPRCQTCDASFLTLGNRPFKWLEETFAKCC